MSQRLRDVPLPTQKQLYALHSGRCSFRGCRKFVFSPATDADRAANTGKIAHIVGERPGAARHDPSWTQDQLDDISNLMLMCGEHHDVIDRQVSTYTPHVLREMKAEHEEWLHRLIRESLEGKRVERTVLLQYDQTVIDETSALDALVPDYTTASVQRVHLDPPGGDWTASCDKQRAALDAIQAQGLPPSLAVFALSSIPMTAHLGHLVGSRCSVRLHQFDRHREGGIWLWPEDPAIADADMLPAVEGLPENGVAAAGPVLLRVSLSAAVSLDDCTAVLPTYAAEVHIRVANPSLGWLRSPRQLEEFGRVYRETLERIVHLVAACTEVHLFAAVPCGAAFEIGRQHNANMHPPLVLYQYGRTSTPRYAAALQIGQGD